jgi:hypothetical protein
MAAIAENIAAIAPKNIKTCVYNVVPTVELEKSQKFNNPAFPFLGTDSQRQEYVSCMNTLLREECNRRGYVFIDVFGSYADAGGFMLPYPVGDTVHIRATQPLIEFMNKYVIGSS